MPIAVAIQMDPLSSINPRSDTTLLIGIEAQKRGHTVWHYTPDKLSWQDGNVTARANRVTLHSDYEHYFDLGEESLLNLKDMQVILLRQDPPFHMGYVSTTYMLDLLHPKSLVVNRPATVRNFPEKWMPVFFKEAMPPTLISADIAQIETFYKTHGDIVLKPLYGYGGRDISRVGPKDGDLRAQAEALLARTEEPLVAQKFLPEIKDQDLRVILFDGDIAGAFHRIPAEGEILSNLRLGGKATKAELTARQKQICGYMKPILKKEGLLFAGVDFIGDYLTEVNLTSPTGFASINALYDTRIEEQFWDMVEKKL